MDKHEQDLYDQALKDMEEYQIKCEQLENRVKELEAELYFYKNNYKG